MVRRISLTYRKGDFMRGLMMVDLDGTLYSTDAPYYRLADELATYIPALTRDDFLRRVHLHFSGKRPIPFGDNWDAVTRLALIYEARPEGWLIAFERTREAMVASDMLNPLPPPVTRFLEWAGSQIRLVLVTNTPAAVAGPVLTRLKAWPLFHWISFAAQKPAGLFRLAHEAWDGPIDPRRTLSIGDHYDHDIGWPYRWGWTTAHISPRGQRPGPTTFRAPTLEILLPALYDWVRALPAADGAPVKRPLT